VLLRAVIVDDEAPARRGLRRMLEAEGDVRIVGECPSGTEAVTTIERESPDVVFLDVQMPELDGFAVLRALRAPEPMIVFVTAFDSHATAAFEAAAVDYLLKPVTATRIRAALARVRQRSLERGALALRQGGEAPGTPGHLESFTVRIGNRTELIPAGQIDWLEADGDYVRAHLGSKVHLVSDNLASLLLRLDPQTFLRIHRARAVNLTRVRSWQRGTHGEYIIHLVHGESLTAGRSYTPALNERLATAFKAR
jgi:two-component system LytT family response regulator